MRLIAFAFLAGLLLAVAVAYADPAPDSSAVADPAPVWRTAWIGSDRYLLTDEGWHAWTPDSEWLLLPPAIVERLGLK